MESTKRTWNDERMDEFAARTEASFKEVRTEVRDVRAEVRDVRTGVRDLRTEMNGRFAKLEATFNRRFDLLLGVLATGFVGAVVSHFLG